MDQKTRTAKYEAAMAKLHERYPQDTEAAVFYALALNEAVDLTDKTYSRQLKAAAILEPLARAQPDHPGIVHLIIHSYDYAPIAAKGLPAARRYATLAPSAPHALHMPSHIFSTLGMWQDAIRSNLAADASAKKYALATTPQLRCQSRSERRPLSLARLSDQCVPAARAGQTRAGDRRAAQFRRRAVGRLTRRLRRIRRLRQSPCATPSSAARGPKRRIAAAAHALSASRSHHLVRARARRGTVRRPRRRPTRRRRDCPAASSAGICARVLLDGTAGHPD